MAHLARLALSPLSLLNAVAGLGLAALAGFTTAVPAWVVAPAIAVATQGLFTLAWLHHRVPVPDRIADLLYVAGQAAALILGTIGLTATMISHAATDHAEFGPPTMLGLVTVHALIGLIAPGTSTPAAAPT